MSRNMSQCPLALREFRSSWTRNLQSMAADCQAYKSTHLLPQVTEGPSTSQTFDAIQTVEESVVSSCSVWQQSLLGRPPGHT